MLCLILLLAIIIRTDLLAPALHRPVLFALATVSGGPLTRFLVEGLGGALLLGDALGISEFFPFGHLLGLWNLSQD